MKIKNKYNLLRLKENNSEKGQKNIFVWTQGEEQKVTNELE